jgi:alkanesulfonate monooxygenase SsuD/methylene tetrahydromethanopterin reductase-like flavin-dependent oxidoreductase (luciferase family)
MTVELGAFVVPEASDPDALLELVLAAERDGLDLIGIQDHAYQRRFLDTFSLLAFLAARIERLRLFPDVANLPLRHPAMLAKAAASIDVLSGGRFELGLGAGAFWDAIEAFGGPRRSGPESVDALEEAIAILRACWVAELGGLAADHGFEAFILWSDGDMAEQVGRFASEVAPALRAG